MPLQLIRYKELPDEALIKAYLESRNSDLFDLLFRRYAGKVYAKCITMLKDAAAAEDATQDIFTKIYLNLAKFGGQSKFSTWVYSITYNYCIDLLRKKQKTGHFFSADIEKAPEKEEEVSDEDLLTMEVDRLKIVLDKLPPGDRAILLMKYNDDLSILEIADILQKSESAIKMKILRAKEKARAVYRDLFPNEND